MNPNHFQNGRGEDPQLKNCLKTRNRNTVKLEDQSAQVKRTN